jgi:hypothetical protein
MRAWILSVWVSKIQFDFEKFESLYTILDHRHKITSL